LQQFQDLWIKLSKTERSYWVENNALHQEQKTLKKKKNESGKIKTEKKKKKMASEKIVQHLAAYSSYIDKQNPVTFLFFLSLNIQYL